MRNTVKIMSALGLRGREERIGHILSNCITGLILVNFLAYVVLCQWTVSSSTEHALHVFGDVCVGIFIFEIIVRMAWEGRDFFQGRGCGWNWFDLIITLISAMAWLPWIIDIPASGIIIFRSLRAFRLLRLFSRFGRIRLLMAAMFSIRIDFLWISALLTMIISMYSVLGCLLYGADAPESFGTFSRSVFTLFQVTTLDGWATDEARPLMETNPSCWIFFTSFVVISSLIILNVVTGIIIEAMSEVSHKNTTEKKHKRKMFERDVDFCLMNDGQIGEQEHEFLQRKAQEYGLRANESAYIEHEREERFHNTVKKYRTLVHSVMQQSPDLTIHQRHLLNSKQRELGLETSIALKIEREVRGSLWPEHKLNTQEMEFKEFYRSLMSMRQHMQKHLGVDDETMDEIRKQLINEGVEV